MGSKKIIYNRGSTYRRDGRKKKKAEADQYFLDQQSATLQKAVSKTAKKFYVYDKVSDGPFYISQIQKKTDGTRVIIRNAKNSRIALNVYQEGLAEEIVAFLNENHD